jgi:hypothetical protein
VYTSLRCTFCSAIVLPILFRFLLLHSIFSYLITLFDVYVYVS